MTGAGQRARGVEEFFAAARADVERRLQEILADPKPALDAARTGAPAPFAASAMTSGIFPASCTPKTRSAGWRRSSGRSPRSRPTVLCA